MMIPFHKFIIFQLGISNFKAWLFVVVPYSHTEIVPSRICCSICFSYTGYVEAEIMITSVITPGDEGYWLRRNDNYFRKCTLDPGLSIDTKYCFPFRFLDSKYNWLFYHTINK